MASNRNKAQEKPQAAPAANVQLDMAALSRIASGQQTHIDAASGMPLAAANLIQVDASQLDTNGNAKAVATEIGIKALKDAGLQSSPQAVTNGAKEQFKVDSFKATAADWASKRKGRFGSNGVSKYDFDSLAAVGDTIYVPATAARPNPAKSMSSLVAQAKKKYGTKVKNSFGGVEMETYTTRATKADDGTVIPGKQATREKMEYSRDFVLRACPINSNDPQKTGARLIRTR